MAHHQFARLGVFLLVSVVAACAETASQPLAPQQHPMGEHIQLSAWSRQKNMKLLASVSVLAETAHRFVLEPVSENRETWQTAWVAAHDDWQSLVYLLPGESADLFQIDAWPIEPGFLDSLPDYPTSGIVNDFSLQLSSTSLRDQHGFTDDTEVALGFHALEYYAFARPLTDFEEGGINLDRRRQLTVLIAETLLADITAFSTTVSRKLPVTRASLLASLRLRNQQTFKEFTLQEGGHSVFSGRSLRNVERQLMTLDELLGPDAGVNHLLIELDPARARTFNRTLKEALGLLGAEGGPSETQVTRITLLLSSLTHQLEEFESIIDG